MPLPSVDLSGSRPEYDDEALVSLNVTMPAGPLPLPYRRILLTKEKPSVRIGRTSKRNASYEATKTNAYFDSAVISREHAVLKADFDRKLVFIRDVGSLHGTFLNDIKVNQDERQRLDDGSILKFGIAIERGSDIHPPCAMEAKVQFGSHPRIENRPTVFRVPDDSDVEDMSCDEEEAQVNHTSRVLEENDFRPARLRESELPSMPVDLTSTEDMHKTYDGTDATATVLEFSGFSSREANKHDPESTSGVDVVDLTSQDDGELEADHPELRAGSRAQSIPGPSQNDRLSAGHHAETITHMSLSDALGVEDGEEQEESTWSSHSSSPSQSPSQSPSRSPSRSPSPASEPSLASDAYAGAGPGERDSLSIDEEGEYDDFEERNDFEAGQDNVHSVEEEAESDIYDGPDGGYDNHGPGLDEAAPAVMSGAMNVDTPELGPVPSCCPAEPPRGTLNPQLPPIGRPEQFLHFSSSGNERLPPLPYQNLPQPVHPPTSHAGHLSSAERLGAKTGKVDYFMAREINKMNQNLWRPPHYKLPPANLSPGIPDMKDDRHPANSSPRVAKDVSQALGGPSSIEPTVGASPGVWSASGVKFLNSPPEEVPEPPSWSPAPVLDETSAYMFEVSKRAASAKAALDAQAPSPPECLGSAETGGNEAAAIQPPSPLFEGSMDATRGLKRKATEMSRLTPEEQLMETRAGPNNASTPEATAATPAVNAAETALHASSASSGPEPARPAKRLRRVAEAFGIAALGGAAVMSALIATAPSF